MEHIGNDLSSRPKPAAAFAVDNLWTVPWIALMTDSTPTPCPGQTGTVTGTGEAVLHISPGERISRPTDDADAIDPNRPETPPRRRLPRGRI